MLSFCLAEVDRLLSVPGLVEVNVSHYKNLEEVHLSWSSGVVLFGPNGSGKSTLLEALTLRSVCSRWCRWSGVPGRGR